MTTNPIIEERRPTPEQLAAAEAVLAAPLPDAPALHPILAAIHAESMALFHPGGGNTHRAEWEPDPVTKRPFYLGASTMVKTPCDQYALRLMLKQQQDDESNGYWARRGNLFAWDHLRKVTPYRENRVTIPLDMVSDHPALAGVDFIGHVDGIRVSLSDGTNVSFGTPAERRNEPHFLTPEEFKNYDAATDGKVDLAGRQVMAYNAALRRYIELCKLVKAGTVEWPYPGEKPGVLPLASFHNPETDPHARPLDLYEQFGLDVEVFGGSVHIDQGRDASGFVQPIDDSDGLSDNVFEWVTQKAIAIMVSVRKFNELCAAHAVKRMVETGANVDAAFKSVDPNRPPVFPQFVEDAMATPGGVRDYLSSPLGLQEFRMEMTAIEAHVDESRLLTEALLYEASRLTAKSAEEEKNEAGAKALVIIRQSPAVDKEGKPIRSLICKAEDGTEVKVTMVAHASGSFYPKVTIRADWGKTAAGIIAHVPKAAA